MSEVPVQCTLAGQQFLISANHFIHAVTVFIFLNCLRIQLTVFSKKNIELFSYAASVFFFFRINSAQVFCGRVCDGAAI